MSCSRQRFLIKIQISRYNCDHRANRKEKKQISWRRTKYFTMSRIWIANCFHIFPSMFCCQPASICIHFWPNGSKRRRTASMVALQMSTAFSWGWLFPFVVCFCCAKSTKYHKEQWSDSVCFVRIKKTMRRHFWAFDNDFTNHAKCTAAKLLKELGDRGALGKIF